jgi:hypothetical protein
MRGAPACEIAVGRSRGWSVAVVLVAVAGTGAMAAWLWTSPLGEGGWARVGVAAGVLAIIALAASLLRSAQLVLRWDGTRWSVSSPVASAIAPASGDLLVALDLGSFLLLRFLPEGKSGPAAVRWIPVERRGLEREWHAFRCAVYSPRPAAGASVADPRLP